MGFETLTGAKVTTRGTCFETLTGAKVTTRGTCSDRTDYFGQELEKVRMKFTEGKENKLFLHIAKNVRLQLLYVVSNKQFHSHAPT